ncbi:MAG: radical SAM protein [Clostridia bacterium]|nr:radical SAM protein [Clostridia bacterium]
MYSRVYVEITDICNRSCSFCPGTKRAPRRMTESEFRIIAEKLKSVTKYLYFHVMGEPLTHPLLPDFIRIANENGYHPAVTTNGTLLASKGKVLVEAGIYKVNISVHSFEDGKAEDYLRYIEDCLDFADYASRNGVLTVLRLWNQGFDGGRNIKTEALIHERFPNEWTRGKRGARIRDKLHLEYDTRFTWPDMEACDMGNSVFCYGLKDHFGILCDGRVIPCCLDREGAVTLGNILENDVSVEEILSSPRALAMRRGFTERRATEELWRKCGYARRF